MNQAGRCILGQLAGDSRCPNASSVARGAVDAAQFRYGSATLLHCVSNTPPELRNACAEHPESPSAGIGTGMNNNTVTQTRQPANSAHETGSTESRRTCRVSIWPAAPAGSFEPEHVLRG